MAAPNPDGHYAVTRGEKEGASAGASRAADDQAILRHLLRARLECVGPSQQTRIPWRHAWHGGVGGRMQRNA
jgi:hypothetical protein